MWEVKILEETSQYELRDEVNRLGAVGWEPISMSVLNAGFSTIFYAMLRKRKDPQ